MKIEIGSDWTAQLDAYVQRLQSEAMAAADQASQYLHETVVERAQQTPGWNDLADHIEVWSQDGYLVIGVRDNEFTSQAFALEYGDEVRPPTPLFRTLDGDMRKAGQIMGDHMQSKFGPGKLT